ncbi:50S ribosomal protein L31 [Candidatus Fokinia solitaria]|uniref:50S ribosomal protein L31 n=1 Tax=Candidatus Fokinia solitaria TaxID=1802984 RepID=A0A2U8BSB2_9RICK|nr:50S ribosomal protein L31 [Candidatus Fokinia solitaria]AWD33231.1 50S ribosomal protein L31 [Candidatus Fokinia solitaria]
MKKKVDTKKKVTKVQGKAPAPTAKKGESQKVKYASSIHPSYKVVEVKDVDGTKFQIRSTYKHSEMTLSISAKNHQAWTSERSVDATVDQVKEFQRKFGTFSVLKD